MSRRLLIGSMALLLLVAAGCGTKKGGSTSPKNVPKIDAPDWYMDPPRDNDRVVGVATATSRDLQTALDKAKQDGRVDIARQLDLRVMGLSKRFVEETGLDADAELLGMWDQVSKTVVSDSIVGSRMAKQKLDRQGGAYRAYVMMEMPIGEASARFLEKIRAEERLYTRFRASEAFDELDREVQAYEEWKRQQVPGAAGR
jgi:hypothetical protein